MIFTVTRYQPAQADAWDEFVRDSRNGTFLLERGFMDYHADRFRDHSLVLHDGSGRMYAVLPAHETADALHSHDGLTYGGFVYGSRGGVSDAVHALDAVRDYMRENSLACLSYRTIPWIYHRQPAEDDRYALFLANARLTRRDVLSVVARDGRLGYQERRSRGMKAALKAGILVGESSDFAEYWPLLTDTLRTRHDASPVHTLHEILLLRSRFPDRIRLFTAVLEGTTVAGVVVFESTRVAHVQYIASGEAGRAVGALDAVFDHLLSGVFVDKPYFDFGTSNDDHRGALNAGLIGHKEGFGARAVVHDRYVLRCAPEE